MDKDHVEIAIEVLAETDRAVKVSNGEVEAWLPKSQMVDFDEKAGVVVIPEWLANDKGLI